MRFRVLFHVQHLLGTGHLQRVALMARALSARDVEVHVISGGFPVPTIDTSGFELHQLEPVKAADMSFSSLVDADGNEVTEALRQRRIDTCVALAERIQPDAIIVETWPFGRRQIRHELLALMACVRHQTPRPLVLASVRDLLHRGRKPKRVEETADLVERWFDHVLVHSDPNFVTLDVTFPLADRFAERIHYTGFIVRDSPVQSTMPAIAQDDFREIVVSAGGGAVGGALYEAAVDAARELPEYSWHVLVGSNLDPRQFAALRERAPSNVLVEWARPDFGQLLLHAKLSLSQAGYNTVMDLLQAGCRAVIVPFDDAGETEQTDRAERLAALGIAETIDASRLNGDVLAVTVARHIAADLPPLPDFRLDGASAVATWLVQRLAQSRGEPGTTP